MSYKPGGRPRSHAAARNAPEGERLPARRPVDEFDPFAHVREEHRVLADHVAAAHRVDADFAAPRARRRCLRGRAGRRSS